MYDKNKMVRMLTDAKNALQETNLAGSIAISEGEKTLIGQLVLASAIDDVGNTISNSIDKLDNLALEIGSVVQSLARGR